MRSFILIFCLSLFLQAESSSLHNWENKNCEVLNPTEEKPARTAILIIAPPLSGQDYTQCRWALGRKVWEQYMNSHPDVDCYFLQSTSPRKNSQEQVWIEGNIIYIGDFWYEEYGTDRILHKTMCALESLLPHYTHFIRTNLNTFFNLHAVHQYAKNHHQSMYTGPLWEKQWYVIGYGALFSQDVAAHMVNEYKRLEGHDLLQPNLSDDHILTSLATGIYPKATLDNPFTPYPLLPPGTRQVMCENSTLTKRASDYGILLLPPITVRSAIALCDKAAPTVFLYRIREGFDLTDLAKVYDYLLNKSYPGLSTIDIVDYASSLPITQEPKSKKK